MIQHTHDKDFLASQYGKFVIFMQRPGMTRQKKYREPKKVKCEWFETTRLAREAAEQWMARNDGKLC